MHVEIRIRGHLSSQWERWFGELTIHNTAHGEAVLSGWLADEATLYGILNQIQALNLSLIAVTRTDSPHDSPLGE